MANAIRVSDGKRWAYVPANGEHYAHLESFAAVGLATVSVDGAVLLKHEAGPIFWDILNKAPADKETGISALKALDTKAINLKNEKLVFGKKDDAISYNQYADLSLMEGEESGVSLAARSIEDGDIVMTAWPKSERLIPAKVVEADKRILLEFPIAADKGDRCFVLDENGKELITVSFESDGSNRVYAMNAKVLDSWLCAAGSQTAMQLGGRFGVSHQPRGRFVIMDGKTGKTYSGTINSPEDDKDNFELEKIHLERLLASKGLGAILPRYILTRN